MSNEQASNSPAPEESSEGSELADMGQSSQEGLHIQGTPDQHSPKTDSGQSSGEEKAPWKDPLIIYDRSNEISCSLRNMLTGVKAFLVCGGPSAKKLDLTQLNQPGTWSIAVNNMAGYYRPNAFVCSDPPSKFHHGIWLDPGVMKFVPTPKMDTKRGGVREKIDDKFKWLIREGRQLFVPDCPNVWGFARRTWWELGDDFFTEDSATWGNGKDGVARTGHHKTFCTMLIAMRILYYLGVRTIFLVGVDFLMTEEGYAFDQGRTSHAISNNNTQYQVINRGLVEMTERGTFKRFGLTIYNCCETSGLRAFPYVPFNSALEFALRGFPQRPFDLAGWYEK